MSAAERTTALTYSITKTYTAPWHPKAGETEVMVEGLSAEKALKEGRNQLEIVDFPPVVHIVNEQTKISVEVPLFSDKDPVLP